MTWTALTTSAFAVAATGGLLGSTHCVGMCGPFVGYAGLGGRRAVAGHLAYQAGRLTTYVSLGVVAGLFGTAVSQIAKAYAVQTALAVGMGLTLVVIGLAYALGWSAEPRPGGVRARLSQRVIVIARLGGGATGGYLLGLGSTLLPCAFLYSFALAAAATGSMEGALLTMTGFWLGTLPSLALTGWVARAFGGRLLRQSRRAIGVALILLGVLGISGRWAAVRGHRASCHQGAAAGPADSAAAADGARDCCAPAPGIDG